MTSPLNDLAAAGQAVWLDYLHRKILENGELRRLIEQDGVTGVTSNPSIFDKAIGSGDDYDDRMAAILAKGDLEAGDLYEALAVADIQAAADQLRPVYDRLHGYDGYVSLEVSPYLAMDTEATIAEARRLWLTVDRPNVMIKVPGTVAGVPAIRTLIGEGININVTLLFSIESYLAVAEAHIAGLEAFKARGGDISRVHGVASFFVSRIDTQIDKAIDARLKVGAGAAAAELESLKGKVAIANAKVAYLRYLELASTPRWDVLAKAGASPQRLLWASTGTKNPAYPDTLYVASLIGPETVNTMPSQTMDAFRSHGVVRPTLTDDIEAAEAVLAAVERLGLDLPGVTAHLVEDGVRSFAEAFDGLLGAVAGKRIQILGDRLNRQGVKLPDSLQEAVDATLDRARAEGWARRLWAKDASLWTGQDEGKWLGWLAAGRGEQVDLEALEAFQAEVRGAGFAHAVLLGMGGSSLGPEVFAETFGAQAGYPKLLVLDSTDPAQIAHIRAQIDPKATLFIVSSKSGTTLEPNILYDYFHDVTAQAVGAADAASHFVAITDPGSKLQALAEETGFRHVFLGDPEIGGRYSVLSNFGMVPAAVMGLDVRAFLETTRVMTRACGPSAPPAANPGFVLGAAMGEAAARGCDKVTILASEGLADLGAWLEQLLAESTGKHGKGLIPVDGEPPGAAHVYSFDRLFAYLRSAERDEPELDGLVRELEEAGHPVVRIMVERREAIGQEFFRWEVAVAVAGAVMALDPFDQPDVEASKVKTRALTEAYEKTGQLDGGAPILVTDGVALYADAANAGALAQAAGADTLEAYIDAHLRRASEGDYIGLLAYLDRSHRHVEALEGVRARIRDERKVATVVGFGPRFLHSTGQAYKGGPNSGVFLQITADPPPGGDIPVPGKRYSFGVVEAATAEGDFTVLAERGRRLLRLHLGSDPERGLKRLSQAVERALG